jgi:hypothetical protein
MNDREGEAASLDVLGLVAADLGDLVAARWQRYDQALAIQRAIGYRRGQGYTLTHLGHALLAARPARPGRRGVRPSAGHPPRAVPRQRRLHRRPGRPGAGGPGPEESRPRPAAWPQECLTWIEAHGLGGIESPTQVYLACYPGAAEAATRRSAAQALDRGYQRLTQMAGCHRRPAAPPRGA